MNEREWYTWTKKGDGILHIELRNWADVMVIAPLTANTLAKITSGICDNLLTTVFRAWKCLERPILVAPSMNRYMWDHPLTKNQLDILESWSIKIIKPRSKLSAGGDFGPAARAKAKTICAELGGSLEWFRKQPTKVT